MTFFPFTPTLSPIIGRRCMLHQFEFFFHLSIFVGMSGELKHQKMVKLRPMGLKLVVIGKPLQCYRMDDTHVSSSKMPGISFGSSPKDCLAFLVKLVVCWIHFGTQYKLLGKGPFWCYKNQCGCREYLTKRALVARNHLRSNCLCWWKSVHPSLQLWFSECHKIVKKTIWGTIFFAVI